ncbi:MAG: hypothetical protein JSU73_04610 [candidate division WOR-3 bacterium]|nr:MAG: hypothetical protein JSU73_04610 [candidate division WOR-3 bacterium]
MIRLLGSDLQWLELLRQVGVPLATERARCDVADSCASVVVIDRDPSPSESEGIRRFVSLGRGVLSSTKLAAQVWPGDVNCRSTRIRYLLPDRTAVFRDVGVTHLDTDGCVSASSNCGFTDRGGHALYAGELGGGWAVLLPFDVSAVLADRKTAPRAFHALAPRQVTETVSRVNRGEVRRIAANSLAYLLARQDLCYVAKPSVPPGGRSLFGLRIDTDFDAPGHYPAVVSLSGRTGVPFTWFLNVEAGEAVLKDVVNGLAGQDLQLHCYRHEVHADYDSNRRELVTGKELLVKHAVVPVGAAGPFGDWNEEWARALSDLGFQYSSEFALAYDDTPFRPIVDGSPSRVLQVPVHPVCLGRLRAAGATPQQIQAYFLDVARRQTARQEPNLLYGHPRNVAADCELTANLLDEVTALCGSGSTLTNFAAWWIERERVEYQVVQDDDALTLDVASSGSEVGIRVVRGDSEAVVPAVPGRVRLRELHWRHRERYIPTEPEIAGSIRLGRLAALREWRRRRQRQTAR